MIKLNKKGQQLGKLTPFIMTVIVIGIVLTIGILILDSFKENMIEKDLENSWAANNESYSTGYNFTDYCNVMNGTLKVYNSSRVELGDSNYTVTVSGGFATKIVMTDAWNLTSQAGDTIILTYNCSTSAVSGINETLQATLDIPDWLELAIIMFIAGIVLAIAFAVLPRPGAGGGVAGVGRGGVAEI